MTLMISLRTKYNDAKSAMSVMNAKQIQTAIAALSTPISEQDVPEILCNPDFFYAWFRYLHYRQNVWGETLGEETIKLQLEFLADEETGSPGDAKEILVNTIRNNTKSLYSKNLYNPKPKRLKYARRTKRSERSSKSKEVGDTVMVSVHSKKIGNNSQNSRDEQLPHGSGQGTEKTELFPT